MARRMTGSWRSTTPVTFLTVRPAETSATTLPSGPVTGTTAWISLPSGPSTLSVWTWPFSEGSMVPTKRFPMRSGWGWLYRMPLVSITTMKSTPAALRVVSARGWSVLDGSDVFRVSWRPREWAKVWATDTDRLRASRSVSCRDWRTRASRAPAASNTTIATWRTNTCPATLFFRLPRGDRTDVPGTGGEEWSRTQL